MVNVFSPHKMEFCSFQRPNCSGWSNENYLLNLDKSMLLGRTMFNMPLDQHFGERSNMFNFILLIRHLGCLDFLQHSAYVLGTKSYTANLLETNSMCQLTDLFFDNLYTGTENPSWHPVRTHKRLVTQKPCSLFSVEALRRHIFHGLS